MSNFCWTVNVSLLFVRESEASLEKGRQSTFMPKGQESSGVEMKGSELTEDPREGLGREIK